MKEIFRRDFLKVGIGGFAGLTLSNGLASALPLDIFAPVTLRPLRFDFILSLIAREASKQHDLGGTIQAGISTEDSKLLFWNHDIPSSLVGGHKRSSKERSNSRFELQTKLEPAASELKLDRLIAQHQNSNLVSITLNENFKISELPNLFSFERKVGNTSYDFLGVIGQSRSDSESVLVTPAQYRTGPLFYDSGWRKLGFGYTFRVKGPEAHPLRPCRSQDTWHYNIEIKKNGRWVANHHFGAYKESRNVCLLYYESRRGTCSKSCTPRTPKYSEVYNFAHKAVADGFRKIGVNLPYAVVAILAYILASLFFSGLVVVAV